MRMRCAVNVPNFGDFADPRTVADLARRAEEAGWDGLFVWDHVVFEKKTRVDIADPWILLTAAALATSRIRLGAMLTPVARRRVSTLARQVTTLDRLSGGRVVFAAGLGAPLEDEFGSFGEPTDPRTVAARLDEGLTALDLLWSGETVSFHGEHVTVEEVAFRPTPVRGRRVPVWIGGNWPNRAPMRRAARWDGAFPMLGGVEQAAPPKPAAVREVRAFLDACRSEAGAASPETGFDLAVCGATPAGPAEAGELLAPLAEAGATWWQETMPWDDRLTSADAMRRRVEQGPPRLG